MKTFQSFAILFLAAVGVSAVPSASDIETIQDAGFTYKGLSEGTVQARSLEARCGENYPPHSDCVIGQCQCSEGYGVEMNEVMSIVEHEARNEGGWAPISTYGCYTCGGGRDQCQPGPGSGECWVN